jgi:transcriptional regulator with XRE-family HTH domain
MEDRLVALLKSEGINPTRFAERIGVQRSSMSHILSGRNKPSYDFIVKILENFPAVNPDWLLRGKGLMYKNDAPQQPGLFDSLNSRTYVPSEIPTSESTQDINESEVASVNSTLGNRSSGTIVNNIKNEINRIKNIDKIVIFYSDKTFAEYHPDPS